jgi:hypothetical protein
MSKNPDMVSELINQLQHLKQADGLLTEIWLALGGGYGGILNSDLQEKLNNYMEFDDSE